MAEVVPEPLNEEGVSGSDLEQTSSPRAPKRRQSSPFSPSSKRLRISPDRKVEETSTIQPSAQEDPAEPSAADLNDPSTNSNLPPPSRRESNNVEERKRGKRLFGGLLSTLSQTGSNTQQKKRQEIEKRQLEKARLQKEEDESRRADRTKKLKEVRLKQQVRFDERAMRIRHSNMLATARFLSTSAEPKLYYKPWKLLPMDAEKIDQQIANTEALVEREISEFNRQHGLKLSVLRSSTKAESLSTEKVGEQKLQDIIPPSPHDGVSDGPVVIPSIAVPVKSNEANATASYSHNENDVRKEGETEKERRRESLDENENHEVLMEGEEDTVIY